MRAESIFSSNSLPESSKWCFPKCQPLSSGQICHCKLVFFPKKYKFAYLNITRLQQPSHSISEPWPASPFRIGRHALNQLLVVIYFRLQLHLDTHQVVVGLHLVLHLRPDLPQLLLQVQYHLVEGGQALTVVYFGVLEGFLQMVDLKGRHAVDLWGHVLKYLWLLSLKYIKKISATCLFCYVRAGPGGPSDCSETCQA